MRNWPLFCCWSVGKLNYFFSDSISLSISLTLKFILQMICIVCFCFRSSSRHYGSGESGGGVVFASNCPSVCECRWAGGEGTITCNNTNLTEIPRNLDSALLILDFDGNSLFNLFADSFNYAGLWNLQRIYLVRCKIQTIDENAFRAIRNLVYLDLSYNILIHVPSASFSAIPELRELKLNNNPILKISGNAFTHTRHLKRLDISDCRIGFVETTAFSGLENTLQALKLNGNRISNVEPAVFTLLHALHSIELQKNPWNCSCLLRPLRHWLLQRTVPLGPSPVCKYPLWNVNKSWAELSKSEFACLPRVQAIQSAVNALEGDNITLSCTVSGITSMPDVRWILRNRVLLNGNFEYPVTDKKPYVRHNVSSGFTNLTILSLELQDSGTYVCVAENVAGKVTAEVFLTVNRLAPVTVLLEKYVTAGILLSVVAVILLCSLILVVRVITSKPISDHTASVNSSLRIAAVKLSLQSAEKSKANSSSADFPKKITESSLSLECTPSGPDCNRSKPSAAEIKKSENDFLETASSKNAAQKPTTLKINKESPRNSMFDSHIGEIALQHHVLHKKELPTGNLYTTAMSFMQEDTKNNYQTTMQANNIKELTNRESSYQRDGRTERYYNHSQSQSPLLQNSYLRDNEDEEEDKKPADVAYAKSRYSTYDGRSRKSSTDKIYSQRGWSTVQRSKNEYRRNEQQDWRFSPSPLKFNANNESHQREDERRFTKETPLLNIDKKPYNDSRRYTNYSSTYERRPSTSSTQLMISPTKASTTYDYHTAQLERFLHEYRQIQSELAKMKESCEKLSQIGSSTERMMLDDSKYSSLERSVSFVPNLKDSSIRSTVSDDNVITPKSILKKTQSEREYDYYRQRGNRYYYEDNLYRSGRSLNSPFQTSSSSLPPAAATLIPARKKPYRRRYSTSSINDYTDY